MDLKKQEGIHKAREQGFHLIIYSIDNRRVDDIVTGKQDVPWQITRLVGLGNANIYILYIERCWQKQDPW